MFGLNKRIKLLEQNVSFLLKKISDLEAKIKFYDDLKTKERIEEFKANKKGAFNIGDIYLEFPNERWFVIGKEIKIKNGKIDWEYTVFDKESNKTEKYNTEDMMFMFGRFLPYEIKRCN